MVPVKSQQQHQGGASAGRSGHGSGTSPGSGGRGSGSPNRRSGRNGHGPFHAITRRYHRVMAEIVIIGAGIRVWRRLGTCSGRGHSVTVIEERTDTGWARGISIWPNALAALTPSTRVTGRGRETASGGATGGATNARRRSGRAGCRRSGIVSALGEPCGGRSSGSRLRDSSSPALLRHRHRRRGRRPVGDAGVRGPAWSCRTLTVRGADAAIGRRRASHSVVACRLNGSVIHRYAGYIGVAGVAAMARVPTRGGWRDDRTGRGGGPLRRLARPDLRWFATERVAEARARRAGNYLPARHKFAAGGSGAGDAGRHRPGGLYRNDLLTATGLAAGGRARGCCR